jgi:hypothetical protein
MRTPRLILVRSTAESFAAPCSACAIVNAWDRGGRRRTDPACGEDAMLCGAIPLEVDEAWVECRHGHAHLVLRQRSKRAALYGL